MCLVVLVLVWGDVNCLMVSGSSGWVVIYGYYVWGIDGGIFYYVILNLFFVFIIEMGVVVVKIILIIEYFSNYVGGEWNGR